MKVGVVIPVGPGHEMLAEDACDSVAAAFERDRGPFTALELIAVDDTQGRFGRSAARNEGVVRAGAAGCAWIFFLDADDLMHPDAFRAARPAIEAGYDGVWGAICELAADEESGVLREGQLATVSGVADLLGNDPWLTLQMGHFVHRELAARTPFDTDLDCGEDFDYYYRVWSSARCVKLGEPLFYNRRGMHSAGPRSATDAQWRLAVEAMIAEHCRNLAFHTDFEYRGEAFRFFVHDPFDAVQRCHLHGRFFAQGDLEALAGRLRSGLHVVEVGANVGNQAVYWGRLLKPRRLTLIEPQPLAVELLQRNLAANAIDADLAHLGCAAGRARGRADLRTAQRHNMAATRIMPAADGSIGVEPLDAMALGPVDFVRIAAGGLELDVLAGARELIARSKPALLVEAAPADRAALERWCVESRYRVVQEFTDAGVLVEPAG